MKYSDVNPTPIPVPAPTPGLFPIKVTDPNPDPDLAPGSCPVVLVDIGNVDDDEIIEHHLEVVKEALVVEEDSDDDWRRVATLSRDWNAAEAGTDGDGVSSPPSPPPSPLRTTISWRENPCSNKYDQSSTDDSVPEVVEAIVFTFADVAEIGGRREDVDSLAMSQELLWVTADLGRVCWVYLSNAHASSAHCRRILNPSTTERKCAIDCSLPNASSCSSPEPDPSPGANPDPSPVPCADHIIVIIIISRSNPPTAVVSYHFPPRLFPPLTMIFP